MNNIIVAFLLTFIAGLSTVIGSFILFFKFKNINRLIVCSLSFSMMIMILISIFDLLPSSIINIIYNFKLILGLIISFLVFLLGFLSIQKLDNIIDVKGKGSEGYNNRLYKVAILSMISLIIHNMPEGMAVFMSSYSNIKLGIKMCIAIMLHNIPEGIIISIPYYYSKKNKKDAIKYTFYSAMSEPLGALIAYIFLKDIFNELILSFILIYVSGLMISLSINNIYKEIKKYNLTHYMIGGYLLAIIIFIITLIL